jgi:hypothetical protein
MTDTATFSNDTQHERNPGESIERLLDDLDWKGTQLELSEAEFHELGGEVWEDLPLSTKKGLETDHLERMKKFEVLHLQCAVRDRLIERWLNLNTQLKNERERKGVKNTIDLLLRADRKEDLTSFLMDVSDKGLNFAESQFKKRQRAGGYFGHAWAAISGLAQLVLCIAVIAAGNSKFEVLVLTSLVLIYIGIDSTYRARSRTAWIMAFATDNQFRQLARKLEITETEEERELRLEAEQKAKADFAKATVRYYIANGFLAVTWFWAMFKLLSQIL